MASIYAPEQDEQPDDSIYDPRRTRAVFGNGAVDPSALGGSIYGPRPAPTVAPAASDGDLYSAPVATEPPGPSPASDDIYSGRPAAMALSQEQRRPTFFGTSRWDAEHKSLQEKANLEAAALEAKARIAEQEGRAKFYSQHGGLYETQAGAGGFRPQRTGMADLVQDAFTDPETGEVDQAKVQSYLSSRGRGARDQMKVGRNAAGKFTYHVEDPATGTFTDTGLEAPPPAATVPSFQAVDTTNGVVPFNSRTGQIGKPTPGAHRVSPVPTPAPTTPLQGAEIAQKVRQLADQRYPRYDAHGVSLGPDAEVANSREVARLSKMYAPTTGAASPVSTGPAAPPSRTTIAPPNQAPVGISEAEARSKGYQIMVNKKTGQRGARTPNGIVPLQ
jgi:hypothetical protein